MAVAPALRGGAQAAAPAESRRPPQQRTPLEAMFLFTESQLQQEVQRMNAIARQCHLEGQHRGEEEMASTVAQVEQFADALYREAVNTQGEYAGQLSIVSSQNDDLSRSLLRAED